MYSAYMQWLQVRSHRQFCRYYCCLSVLRSHHTSLSHDVLCIHAAPTSVLSLSVLQILLLPLCAQIPARIAARMASNSAFEIMLASSSCFASVRRSMAVRLVGGACSEGELPLPTDGTPCKEPAAGTGGPRRVGVAASFADARASRCQARQATVLRLLADSWFAVACNSSSVACAARQSRVRLTRAFVCFCSKVVNITN